jgi:hypothetical protein
MYTDINKDQEWLEDWQENQTSLKKVDWHITPVHEYFVKSHEQKIPLVKYL